MITFNKAAVLSLIAISSLHGAQQKFGTHENPVKGNLYIIPALGAFRKIKELEKDGWGHNVYRAADLRATYKNVTSKTPLVQVQYYSDECGDWNNKRHPQLQFTEGDYQMRTDHLPLLLPIGSKLPQGKKTTAFIPVPNCSLFDLVEGDTIVMPLPIKGYNTQYAQLTCTASHGKPFHVQTAITSFSRGITEDQLKIAVARIAAYEKEQKEAEAKKAGEKTEPKPESKSDKQS